MGRGPCVVLVLVLLSLTCEFQSVNAAVVQGSSNSSQLREQFLSNYKKAYRSAADLFPPSVVKIMESVVDKVAQGAQESFSPGSRDSLSKLISETRGGIGSGKIRIAPILRSLLSTHQTESMSIQTEPEAVSFLEDDPRESLMRTADTSVEIMLVIIFLLLFFLPITMEVYHISQMTCYGDKHLEFGEPRDLINIKSEKNFLVRQIEIPSNEEAPAFEEVMFVHLGVEAKSIAPLPVVPPVANQKKAENLRLIIRTPDIGFPPNAAIVVNMFDGTQLSTQVSAGDILLAFNCEHTLPKDLITSVHHDRDTRAFNDYVKGIRGQKDLGTKTLLIHALRVNCAHRSGETGKPFISLVSDDVCDKGLPVDSFIGALRSVKKSSRNKFFESSFLEVDNDGFAGVDTLGKILRVVFMSVLALVTIVLCTILVVKNKGGRKAAMFQAIMRFGVAPILVILCLFLAPAISFTADNSTAPNYAAGALWVSVAGVVMIVISLAWTTMLTNNPKNKPASIRPIHFHRLLHAAIVLVGCFLPAYAVLTGRTDAANGTLQQLRARTLAMNWVSSLLSTVAFLVSVIQICTDFAGMPPMTFFGTEIWELLVTFVQFSNAAFSFLEYCRNSSANGAACSYLNLETALGAFGTSFNLKCSNGYSAAAVPGGQNCLLECANGYRTAMTCYDYGLIGGAWSQMQEGTFDNLKAKCGQNIGCSASAIRASKNCASTGTLAVGTSCVDGTDTTLVSYCKMNADGTGAEWVGCLACLA